MVSFLIMVSVYHLNTVFLLQLNNSVDRTYSYIIEIQERLIFFF